MNPIDSRYVIGYVSVGRNNSACLKIERVCGYIELLVY